MAWDSKPTDHATTINLTTTSKHDNPTAHHLVGFFTSVHPHQLPRHCAFTTSGAGALGGVGAQAAPLKFGSCWGLTGMQWRQISCKTVRQHMPHLLFAVTCITVPFHALVVWAALHWDKDLGQPIYELIGNVLVAIWCALQIDTKPSTKNQISKT